MDEIDLLQSECMKPDIEPRALFVTGNILDQKKTAMTAEQYRRQREIEVMARQKFSRVMGYQYRKD